MGLVQPIEPFERLTSPAAHGLVVFLMETLLLPGPGVDALLSRALGQPEPAPVVNGSRRDLAAQRVLLARRYAGTPRAQLVHALSGLELAANAHEAVALLRRRSIVCAVASSSWDFAVELVADRLGIAHALGTGFSRSGKVVNVWPEDLAGYPARLAHQLGMAAAPHTLVAGPEVEPLYAARALLARWP